MRKYAVLFVIIIFSLLAFAGCKALSGNGNGNGNGNGSGEINVVGTWLFTNVLQSDPDDVHTRKFTLSGDANSGTVSETISSTSGTYTVTGNTFTMSLTSSDVWYSWTYEYEGTIIDNDNMSGTARTTTYPAEGGDPLGVYDYNFTAERQQ